MNKRLLWMIIFCCVMLSGCAGEAEPEVEEDIDEEIVLSEAGEWQGNTYVIPGYYLAFDKPDNWVRLLPGEIDELFGEGSSEYYKMIVVNNTNKIIITMFFEDNNGLEQEEYLESVREVMEKETTAYSFQEVYTDEIAGMEFALMWSQIEGEVKEGALSNQVYLVHEQGERVLCINIKYDQEYESVVQNVLEEKFRFDAVAVLAQK